MKDLIVLYLIAVSYFGLELWIAVSRDERKKNATATRKMWDRAMSDYTNGVPK